MTVLMVGLSLSILEKLKKDSDYEIIVMDSWEQYNNYSFDKKKYQIIQETYIADITNPNYYLPVLNEIKEKYIIDGVIPSRDYAVRTAAIIAEKLGKKGIGFEKAKILTNKYFLRKACEEYSIPHPRFRQIDSEKEIAEFIKDKQLILKPTRLQASIGISRIETKEDISDAWERTSSAREESAKEIEFGQEKEYVVEEYVGGQEYSVEALVDDGKIVFINITEKEIFEDSFVEKGHIVPANIDERLIEQFENEETNLVSKIGITNGMLHTEWKVENNKIYLIECAARMPGDYIFELIQYSYDFNYVDAYMKMMCGKKYDIKRVNSRVSQIKYFEAVPGILRDIDGIENLLEDYVVDWCLYKNIGEEIKPVNSSWDRVGYFIVVADDYDDLERLTNKILANVKFITQVEEK